MFYNIDLSMLIAIILIGDAKYMGFSRRITGNTKVGRYRSHQVLKPSKA
jgi:hypothetical protein